MDNVEGGALIMNTVEMLERGIRKGGREGTQRDKEWKIDPLANQWSVVALMNFSLSNAQE